MIGPRLVVPGPFVDGPHPVWPGSIKVAHVPLEVGVAEASNAGQRSVEHLMGILLYWD